MTMLKMTGNVHKLSIINALLPSLLNKKKFPNLTFTERTSKVILEKHFFSFGTSSSKHLFLKLSA